MVIFEAQSTRPRGARPTPTQPLSRMSGFNPRAREGRDVSFALPAKVLVGFNPRAREGRDVTE